MKAKEVKITYKEATQLFKTYGGNEISIKIKHNESKEIKSKNEHP